MAQKQKGVQMDETKNVLTPEEIEQEQNALKLAKEEEVKASIISEFGFDEELDADKIEKVVAKEMESRKKLSEAIGQKIKHREEAEKLRKAIPLTKSDVKIDSDEVSKLVDTKLNETLEKRDLDSLDYPEEIKSEISKLAKLNGISIKKAVLDPYIAFKIEEYNQEQKIAEATISRTHKSKGSKEFDINNPPEFDMNDVEGSNKAMEEWKKEAKSRGF